MIKIDFIVMAAGNSRRFGKNKLLHPIQGYPMYCFVLDQAEQAAEYLNKKKKAQTGNLCRKTEIPEYVCRIFTVTQFTEIQQEIIRRRNKNRHLWQPPVYSPESTEGVSFTIRNGIQAAGEESDYYMFLTADQPFLKAASMIKLVEETLQSGKGIGSMCWKQEPGNPVIFHNQYLSSLLSLEGDRGGRQVVKVHLSDCWFCQVGQPEELADVDTMEALSMLEKISADLFF